MAPHSLASLIVNRDQHPPGEYFFTPVSLALSVPLRPCKVEMRFDGRVWNGTSRCGDIHIMPRGDRRIFRHREACHFVFIGIDDDQIALDGEPPIRPQAWVRDKPLRHAIDALVAEMATGSTTTLFRDAIGSAIVGRLHALDGHIDRPIRHELPERALSSVLEYLDARVAEDVSVADLAAVAGLSPAHFSTLFRNSVGEPPHRYHTRLRVERASRLLEKGVTSSDAALAVGFFDQSHLARHVRRILGTSPSKLRRSR
jgi:AraC family transcriptional regulator